MKRLTVLLFLGLLTTVVRPIQGQTATGRLQSQTPSTAREYFNRGFARQANGDLEGAVADYTKAIEVDPSYLRAYLNRGNAGLG